ncbi:pupal cuticle protein Edg-78E-like isoform X2 [Episyrphus balteatus]|uniref:pupal cuticle protein Edg-78E-like isoform X2 n=1 Tax=Episyrphus balteatus TaxID=286459 RepID=UPI00248680C0|nr:pupal cuticle protein Edg-78E-like isoform X2 [Episyrphus balteatus]
MFKFIALVALFGLATAARLEVDPAAQDFKIIENDITPEGTFRYAFTTGNGIQAKSSGDANVITGAFKYVSPEGQTVVMTYTADADGYHPAGDLLPTPPPVPEAILRSLAYNLAHPQKDAVLARKL